MALSKGRETRKRAGDRISHPVAAGVTIHKGALVVLENGFAKPGKVGTGLTAAGCAEGSVTNSGADGAVRVECRRDGLFCFANSTTDAVTRAKINKPCFIIDDETVAGTHATNTRSEAGIVRDLEDGLVWIEFN